MTILWVRLALEIARSLFQSATAVLQTATAAENSLRVRDSCLDIFGYTAAHSQQNVIIGATCETCNRVGPTKEDNARTRRVVILELKQRLSDNEMMLSIGAATSNTRGDVDSEQKKWPDVFRHG